MTPTMTAPKPPRRRPGRGLDQRVREGPGHGPRFAAERGRTAEDRRLLAGVQLPRPRDDVPEGQPAPEGAAQAGARQGPAARPLGGQPGPGLLLHPPEPGDQGPRPGRGLHGRAGARRAGRARPVLPRGVVLRGLPGLQRGRGGDAAVLQAVLASPAGSAATARPETPGSIHEGGELGYVLSHACGAAFDNPDLIVAAVVGDGESETGPLATSWHINKFLNPIRDGAVLPILHLNGYKINNPTIWARVPHDEIEAFFRGTGWTPYFVEGSDPEIDAPGDGRDDRQVRRRHPRRAEAGPRQRQAVPPAVADDRPAHPEGLDQPGGGRRAQARRKLAVPPGADGRRQEGPGPAEAARRLDAELQAAGAVRRRGAVQAGAEGHRPDRARGGSGRTRTPTAGT